MPVSMASRSRQGLQRFCVGPRIFVLALVPLFSGRARSAIENRYLRTIKLNT